MSDKRKSFDLDKEIRNHMKREKTIELKQKAVLNKMLEISDQRAADDPILGIEALLVTVTSHRNLFKITLHEQFGYDVPSFGASATSGTFAKPKHMPRTPEEIGKFVVAWSEWAAREVAFVGMVKVLVAATDLTQDTYLAIRDKCKKGLEKLSELKLGLLLYDSYAEGRLQDWIAGEDFLAWFSARVAIGTSLQVNRRLRQSLKEVNDSPFSRLLEELPGTVRLELEDIVEEGKSPAALIRRVARQLERSGSQSAYLQGKGKLESDEASELSTDEPMLDEFLAKEELYAIQNSAGLSEREYQVLELMLEGSTEGESAETLGLSTGSIKQLRYRARRKLREAAGL